MGGRANQRLRKRGVEEGTSGGGRIGKGRHCEGWHSNWWHDDSEEQHGKMTTSRGSMARWRHGETAAQRAGVAQQRVARQRAAQQQQGAARREDNGKGRHNGGWHNKERCNNSKERQVEMTTARGGMAGGMIRRVALTRGGMVSTTEAQKAAQGGGS
jgi:hypothetical protein